MALLPIHIIAGLTGIVSGFIALYTLKGAKLHRKSGMVFVYAMLVVALTGTVMGAVLSEMSAAAAAQAMRIVRVMFVSLSE